MIKNTFYLFLNSGFLAIMLLYKQDFILNIFEGRRHDAGMLVDSQVYNDLSHFAFDSTGRPM